MLFPGKNALCLWFLYVLLNGPIHCVYGCRDRESGASGHDSSDLEVDDASRDDNRRPIYTENLQDRHAPARFGERIGHTQSAEVYGQTSGFEERRISRRSNVAGGFENTNDEISIARMNRRRQQESEDHTRLDSVSPTTESSVNTTTDLSSSSSSSTSSSETTTAIPDIQISTTTSIDFTPTSNSHPLSTGLKDAESIDTTEENSTTIDQLMPLWILKSFIASFTIVISTVLGCYVCYNYKYGWVTNSLPKKRKKSVKRTNKRIMDENDELSSGYFSS
ncbi:hypothetical protein SNE40_019267 [Patella caerulea]|uniref:Uncharacterized protein n=1 Tax=Patella caerulea TaxID=87958 RepID=A0AAN8PI72_PATCE